MTLMVKLAVKAVQAVGYKLDNVNETVGLVTFETGMSWGSWSGAVGSLTIEELGVINFGCREPESKILEVASRSHSICLVKPRAG